jgi:RNA polymerase sigma-70 factor, ECF subfamily
MSASTSASYRASNLNGRKGPVLGQTKLVIMKDDAVTRTDDYALVDRARAHDAEAFSALVLRFRSKVWGLALRMMKDPGDAEEVLQETLLSAWQNLPEFRGESAFSSWLYRICANFCLMRLRRKRLQIAERDDDPDLPGPRFDARGTLLGHPSNDWARGTEEIALENELRRAIEDATASLPDDYRVVFLLKDLDGLSYEEISEALGASLPTVKSRLHRARLALRESLDLFYSKPRKLFINRGMQTKLEPLPFGRGSRESARTT